MERFRVETQPAVRDVRVLEDGLYDYNAEQTGVRDGQWLSIFVRDDKGEIVAGLHGWTWCRACKVMTLWVREDHRRRRYGSRLLRAAEEEARARGCERIFLETFSFQARGFYEKLGYEVIGETEGFPCAPHSEFHLRKSLR